jgi:hypothetical protein
VRLAPHGRPPVVVSARPQLLLGRDPLCELPLRSPGVSRQHARIDRTDPGGFVLRDLGSRGGTRIGGMPLAGPVPLIDRGRFALGDEYEVDFEVSGEPARLRLAVCGGMDQGLLALVAGDGQPIPLAAAGLGGVLRFEGGRPLLAAGPDEPPPRVNGGLAARGVSQLIRGDQLVLAGVEVEVA